MKNFHHKIKMKVHPRVIAGIIKGKLIECPPGEIRPMTSKVKEALFNIIGDCSGLTMLDLFSGSGNISIEAYSRGLLNSDLVESDYQKKKVIEKNLLNAGFENSNLFIQDVFDYCNKCNKTYDFIMVDPPFNWGKKEELLNLISEKQLLNDNGYLIIHLTKKEVLNEQIGKLISYDKRKYGLNVLIFYKIE